MPRNLNCQLPGTTWTGSFHFLKLTINTAVIWISDQTSWLVQESIKQHYLGPHPEVLELAKKKKRGQLLPQSPWCRSSRQREKTRRMHREQQRQPEGEASVPAGTQAPPGQTDEVTTCKSF